MADVSRVFRLLSRTTIVVATLLIALLLFRRTILEPSSDPAAVPTVKPVPAFRLTNQNGSTFSNEDFQGNVWIVSFIYTTCPGPCPRIIDAMKDVDRRLARPNQIRLAAISVDPETDTPEALRAYAASHRVDINRWTFLTGNPDAVFDFVRNGFMLAMGEPSAEERPITGPIIHSSKLALIDHTGIIRGYYDSDDTSDVSLLIKHAQSLADRAQRLQ